MVKKITLKCLPQYLVDWIDISSETVCDHWHLTENQDAIYLKPNKDKLLVPLTNS